jgi:hypothetical protein
MRPCQKKLTKTKECWVFGSGGRAPACKCKATMRYYYIPIRKAKIPQYIPEM